MNSKYAEVRKIGSGTFGTAVLCRVLATGEQVVIKKINVQDLPEDERRTSRREASLLANLSHPCVLRHVESFEEDGYLCIVTQYCEHGDLDARLRAQRGTPVQESQVLDWLVQLLLALLYIHKRKVLHRDLKAANIFLTADNNIRLGDFGIARVLKHTMECAKTVVGTPYYISPEIVDAQPYNHKSDVWSCGCLLYEIIAQRHPFEASSLPSLFRKIKEGQYPSLPTTYSLSLRSIVDAMLQQKPRARPSVVQLLALPLLKPYIDAFVARATMRGEVVPHVDLIAEVAATVGGLGIAKAAPLSSAGNGVVTPVKASQVLSKPTTSSGFASNIGDVPNSAAVRPVSAARELPRNIASTPHVGSYVNGSQPNVLARPRTSSNEQPPVVSRVDTNRAAVDMAIAQKPRPASAAIAPNVETGANGRAAIGAAILPDSKPALPMPGQLAVISNAINNVIQNAREHGTVAPPAVYNLARIPSLRGIVPSTAVAAPPVTTSGLQPTKSNVPSSTPGIVIAAAAAPPSNMRPSVPVATPLVTRKVSHQLLQQPPDRQPPSQFAHLTPSILLPASRNENSNASQPVIAARMSAAVSAVKNAVPNKSMLQEEKPSISARISATPITITTTPTPMLNDHTAAPSNHVPHPVSQQLASDSILEDQRRRLPTGEIAAVESTPAPAVAKSKDNGSNTVATEQESKSRTCTTCSRHSTASVDSCVDLDDDAVEDVLLQQANQLLPTDKAMVGSQPPTAAAATVESSSTQQTTEMDQNAPIIAGARSSISSSEEVLQSVGRTTDRISTLRQFLTMELGESYFLRIHSTIATDMLHAARQQQQEPANAKHIVQPHLPPHRRAQRAISITPTEMPASARTLKRTIQRCFREDPRRRRLLPLLFQLVYLEERAYAAPTHQ